MVDAYNYRVQVFTTGGTYLTQWGSVGTGNGQFYNPYGIGFDAAGNVYVADTFNHRIQKFVIAPAIALVSDVPNDDGLQAQIRFFRSSADAPGAGVTVTGYEIYRRSDPSGGWTYLMTAPATAASEYDVVVPTLVDANASSVEYTAFLVRASTSAFTVYDSGVESGYSIDNLAPPVPSPFTAAYVSGATYLHWGVCPASDFATFRLYRGASADFDPSPGNLLIMTTDTSFVHPGAAGSWYKLSAVDLNGHVSGFALVGPGQTTSVPVSAVEFALDGVRPNPAVGGRLRVHFSLPSGAPATLELFDLSGRRIAERAVGLMGAGRHAVDLASGGRLRTGIYVVRLTQGTMQRSVRAAVID